MNRVLLCATCIVNAASPAFADECEDVPPFIGMYGNWESAAVRAEPAEILEVNADMATPHHIHGSPTEVCPGIEFVVEQEIDGEIVVTQLTYVYDASMDRSFGVITGSNGVRLRGEIEHKGNVELLTLKDFEGNVVWTETKIWTSPDEFESEGVFEFNGEDGHVWFRTYRVTD